MQFMSICKVKADMLPPLDVIGLEPSDQALAMSHGGSGHHRQSSGAAPPPRQNPVSLGFNTSSNLGKPPAMANLSVKLTSEERFAVASGRLPSGSIPPNMQQFSHPSPMVRSTSQGGGSSIGSGRTCSMRGQKMEQP
jgi:translation initiation factor 4G